MPAINPLRRSAGEIVISTLQDHPKFAASSALVQTAARAICDALREEGYQLVPLAVRDGFFLQDGDGGKLRIDPKVEALRIRIGHHPLVPPPTALVHGGRQPDWIEVRPDTQASAIAYLRALVRA